MPIRSTDYHNESFKFFVHGIGEDRKDGPTLVFTPASTGLEQYYPDFGKALENKLTENDPSSPPDTGRFNVISKTSLDGVALLVRINVDARETDPMDRPPLPNTCHATTDEGEQLLMSPGENDETDPVEDGPYSASPSSLSPNDLPKSSGLVCIKSGELISDEPQLVEIRGKNKRYRREIKWKDFYWQLALGCAHKLVLGLHVQGTFGRMQEIPIKEVKNRAEQKGSTSMVYLANTLREVKMAAQFLMAPSASSSGAKGGKDVRPALVVEHSPSTPRGDGTLRVRLAVSEDGAVSPSSSVGLT